MARFLVDTSVLIDLSKGIPATQAALVEMVDAGDELCVCAIVLTEFYSGLRPQDRPRWEVILRDFRFLPATRTVAMGAGNHRYDLARRGRAFQVTDALIAAVAHAWGATLLTENPKHFSLPDLVVRSLRT